jgi:hypothetical protein
MQMIPSKSTGTGNKQKNFFDVLKVTDENRYGSADPDL